MSNARYSPGENVFVSLREYTRAPDSPVLAIGKILYTIQVPEIITGPNKKQVTNNVWFYDIELKSGHLLTHIPERFLSHIAPVKTISWDMCVFVPEDISNKKEP